MHALIFLRFHNDSLPIDGSVWLGLIVNWSNPVASPSIYHLEV